MLGRFILAVAVGPAVAQPGNHDNAPAEATVAPAIFRNSLLVCLFMIEPKKYIIINVSRERNRRRIILCLSCHTTMYEAEFCLLLVLL